MRWLGFALFLVAAGSQLPAARANGLSAPAEHGMIQIAQNIYVEPGIPAVARPKALELVKGAQGRAALFYGELTATPNIVFCATVHCYRKFGAVGLGFTDGRNVVISPSGARVAIVAHELSHVELAARLGGLHQLMAKVPQWFDEGNAVMVSMAEEFSERAWLDATGHGEDAPRIYDLESVDDWNRITGNQGSRMQHSYGTARHEVARWFDKVGRDGFLRLVDALVQNESFYLAYGRIEASAYLSRRLAIRGDLH